MNKNVDHNLCSTQPFEDISDTATVDESDTSSEISSVSNSLMKIPKILELVYLKTKTYRVSAVALKRSPLMMCHYKHHPVPLVLDTGAENNVISDIICKKLGLKIMQTSSQAQQVDKSPLKSIGRIFATFSNAEDSWGFDGLVCSGIGDVIIAGNPFLAQGINPVTNKNQIEIVSNNGSIRSLPWRPVNPAIPVKPKVFLLKIENKLTIYPEEFVELSVPGNATYLESSEVLVLPRLHSTVKMVECLPATLLAPSPNQTLRIVPIKMLPGPITN